MPIGKKRLDRFRQSVLDAIGSYRGLVLDTFEAEFGGNPHWQAIRGKLLRCFGDRGLTGRIENAIKAELEGSTNDNQT